jgi:RHS repeat-associated protein
MPDYWMISNRQIANSIPFLATTRRKTVGSVVIRFANTPYVAAVTYDHANRLVQTIYPGVPVYGSGSPAETSVYTAYDLNGNIMQVTDEERDVTDHAYEAFGNETVSSGTTPADRQRASTKEQDPTGFLNEGFRYRDLSTGTFLTRDPLGFKAGLNNYTYVRQNPWTKFDPEGLDSTSITPPPPPPSESKISTNVRPTSSASTSKNAPQTKSAKPSKSRSSATTAKNAPPAAKTDKTNQATSGTKTATSNSKTSNQFASGRHANPTAQDTSGSSSNTITANGQTYTIVPGGNAALPFGGANPAAGLQVTPNTAPSDGNNLRENTADLMEAGDKYYEINEAATDLITGELIEAIPEMAITSIAFGVAADAIRGKPSPEEQKAIDTMTTEPSYSNDYDPNAQKNFYGTH